MNLEEFKSLIDLIDLQIKNFKDVRERTGRVSWDSKIEYWENIRNKIVNNSEIKKSIEDEFSQMYPGYNDLQ